VSGIPGGLIADAVAAVVRGELVVLPTDTVYGIGSRPDDPAAMSRLFAAKGRPRDLELPVLVPGVDAAREVASLDDRASVLVERFWPGPLTIVAPRTPASARWDLGGDDATVGIRMPRHPLALALLERTGPMAVTSANRSGEPPATTCDALIETFGEAVTVYLCEDAPLEGAASTVVDLAHGEPRVLRAGGVSGEALAAALAG
jgi:tRNA threonylcarbamoyl adenosine modification protein (Sua5/YciO/YrdC/YwlC family)